MGLWANTLGLLGLTQKKDDVPDSQGFKACEDGSLPVITLLEDCDDNEAFISNIASCITKSKQVPARHLAHHKMWGAVLDTIGTTPCIVVTGVAPDFKDILQGSGSKNDCAWMFEESLSNFYEEVAQNT
eukprot:2775370-Ditylum_brightwellii.AAC.1